MPVADAPTRTTGYGSLALASEVLDAAFDPAVEAAVAALFQVEQETRLSQ
ncbi:MAG: hypothetical protein RKR03_14155 [Candidatus Competibacter sp.]|nr:hypothetical protein [Candidatus Competibacter sp.]